MIVKLKPVSPFKLVSEFELVKSDNKYTVIHGDIMKEIA